MTMRERIANGKLWTDMCEGLPEDRLRGKRLMFEFNRTSPDKMDRRNELMQKMFGAIGKNCWIEPPIYFAYGTNVFLGENVYINYNLTLVDDYKIFIGNGVNLAPNVTIAVTGHPIDPKLRADGYMYALPVAIKDNVWIGSSAVICPGVTIGENSVIGAGSIVTKNIPANVVAVGNPCRVLRPITDEDRECWQIKQKDD